MKLLGFCLGSSPNKAIAQVKPISTHKVPFMKGKPKTLSSGRPGELCKTHKKSMTLSLKFYRMGVILGFIAVFGRNCKI